MDHMLIPDSLFGDIPVYCTVLGGEYDEDDDNMRCCMPNVADLPILDLSYSWIRLTSLVAITVLPKSCGRGWNVEGDEQRYCPRAVEGGGMWKVTNRGTAQELSW